MIKFNRQVEKKIKIYTDAKLLKTDLDKKYFTKHGQHLNLLAKEQISMKLTTVIKEFFTKKQLSLFACNGKILSLKNSNLEQQNRRKGSASRSSESQ
jgi:hypothetical protein